MCTVLALAPRAGALEATDLESQLPGAPPPAPKLPLAYRKTVDSIITKLRDSLGAEAAGATELEVRRKADPAKESVREFVRRWQDDPAVTGTPSHLAIRAALAELGAFYQRAGPRSRLEDGVRDSVLGHLSEAEAALPPPERRGSILGL